MAKTYTEEEVEQLKQGWESDLFEQKTNDTLVRIERRLDEANGYKKTIGKDVLETKQEVRDIKGRIVALEDARKEDARKVKEDLAARQEAEDKKHVWFQDKWIRAGIAGGLIWEAWTIFSGPIRTAVQHLGLG